MMIVSDPKNVLKNSSQLSAGGGGTNKSAASAEQLLPVVE